MKRLKGLKLSWVLGLVLMLALPLAVFADNVIVDGDGLEPVTSNALNLGSTCLGQQKSGNVLLAIQRSGSGQVYANGATVTISAGAPSGDASVSTAFTDSGIALPGNWVGVPNNTMSSDTATSAVTVNTTGSTLGAKSASVEYTAKGARNGGGELSRTATLTINWSVITCDTTPPVISTNVAGALGNNGWYVSDVNVSWSVTDAESAISSTSGCGNVTISADTAGQTVTCSATSAGGTNSQSVTIKRDATPPTIGGSALPAPNAHGWNNSNVNVSFTCNDSLSGIASCGPDQTLSSEGANQSAMGIATDMAGNSASVTVSGINIDKTAPSVSASALPAPNANGWNKTNVTVSFIGSDGGSGIDSCDAPVTLSSEGMGQSASGSCTDLAGNSASDTATINIDKTAPTIGGSASPTPNTNGWNKTNVDVSFTCNDSLSGIAACGPDQTLSGEGSGQSATGTATDLAGNSASDTVSDIKIDKTPPTLTPSVWPNPVFLGGSALASPNAADNVSDIAASSCGTPNTSSVGAKSVSCSAVDKAGNMATASANYSVIYNFAGFFRPVDNLPTLNQVKAGSAIPIKFSLNGNQGLSIFATGHPSSAPTSCDSTAPLDAIEEIMTAGSSSLSYDASADQYNYVWKTNKAWTGCRQLVVKFVDGMEYRANFKFTK